MHITHIVMFKFLTGASETATVDPTLSTEIRIPGHNIHTRTLDHNEHVRPLGADE